MSRAVSARGLGHELINCGDLSGNISFCGKALGVERSFSVVTGDTTLSTKRKLVALKGGQVFGALNILTGSTGPLLNALLPKTCQNATTVVAVYESINLGQTRRLTASDAHMAADARVAAAAVDDEIVPLWFAIDCLMNGGIEQRIVFACAYGRS